MTYLVCRFKGDTKLEESEKIIFEQDGDTYRLVIREAQITESGSYTVKATNEVSSVTTQAKLKVKGEQLMWFLWIYKFAADNLASFYVS